MIADKCLQCCEEVLCGPRGPDWGGQ
jgi:hypothetical protein